MLKPMRYPEHLIAPMRSDLTQYGIQETRTPEELDAVLDGTQGTVMVVINSVCGCAAGKARPGVGLALKHSAVKPDAVATVFAGADIEAVARLRERMPNIPASSPAVAIFRDGQPVYMMHRHQIENNIAPAIAEQLQQAFGQFCAQKV